MLRLMDEAGLAVGCAYAVEVDAEEDAAVLAAGALALMARFTGVAAMPPLGTAAEALPRSDSCRALDLVRTEIMDEVDGPPLFPSGLSVSGDIRMALAACFPEGVVGECSCMSINSELSLRRMARGGASDLICGRGAVA